MSTATGEYVSVGVDYCTVHHGIRNEDEDRCDFGELEAWESRYGTADEPDECDLKPLVYFAAGPEGTP